MRRYIGLVILVIVAAVSASAMDISVDYDRSGRFSWYKTFAWKDTDETSLEGHNDLMHSRIKTAIMQQLSQGRMTENTDNPDLYVTYHAGSRQAVYVDPGAFGYGFGGAWGGVGASTARSFTYEQGTLVIDIWEAETKKLVWRGVAVDAFSDNPDKADKKINKAIEKMISKWRKMKPGL
jgi:hypothetical protein